jgi:hypothetical protein
MKQCVGMVKCDVYRHAFLSVRQLESSPSNSPGVMSEQISTNLVQLPHILVSKGIILAMKACVLARLLSSKWSGHEPCPRSIHSAIQGVLF